jgi:hypothetical protein
MYTSGFWKTKKKFYGKKERRSFSDDPLFSNYFYSASWSSN